MYAFLSKVFGLKKDDKDPSSSSQSVLFPGELLGGRFEAISPNVSPTAQFLELDRNPEEAKDKDKEKNVGFSFFKGKWRPASPDVKPSRKLHVLPYLSLNFQEPGAVSTAPDLGLLFSMDHILSDAVIGQRRLNPSEALVLVQTCSQAIVAKGLESLGIMHPHWHAASHEIQRRVISHFIYLLNVENSTSISSPAPPTSPVSAFETEVQDTFSPHDVAAILRWGLRHVQIEGGSLGTDDGWYKAFLEAESAAGYPPKAFSDALAPLLPTAHLQLLTATLEIFSSLAAHAEANGTSGSKLCKTFGLWLLTAHRVENKDDLRTFYARWERTGRMLEHLFLSRIREESTDQRMPIRLLELVHAYPYAKGLSPPITDLPLLPRPPFTTRLYDALFVRIETELPYGKRKPSSKMHPLILLADAFSTKVVEGEYADLWAKISTASKDGDSSSLSNIFTDDTIRILSLVPEEPIPREVRSPTFNLASPTSPHNISSSVDNADKSETIMSVQPKSATEISPLTPLTNNIGADWGQFSTSGFLEVSPNIIPLASTLLDTDIEKTTRPEPVSRRSSKRSKAASPSSPRKSFDLARSETETPEGKLEDIEEPKTIIKASQLQIIQLDEAFIDFWSDSLLDPISADWPTFIICKFKSSLVPELTFGVAEEGQKQKTIQWLVLEQAYTIRPPPSIPVETVRLRSASPDPHSTSGIKRFSFWSVSRTASSSSGASHKGKKKDQELKVGEMGELLEEEPRNESKESTVQVKSPIFKSRKSLDVPRKPTEATKKSVIEPVEETKIDKETAAVAAVASGIVVASTAAVITHGLPVDHSADIHTIEAVPTATAATETVVLSPESTVKGDDIPLSYTASPNVISSLEAKLGTEPPELETFVAGSTAIATEDEVPEMYSKSELQPKLTEAESALPAAEEAIIVNDTVDRVLEPEVIGAEDVVETEDRFKTESISATREASVVVEPEVASVADAASIAPQAPGIEVEETVSVLAQHEPIVAPLAPEAAISRPEIETEPPVKLTTVEPLAVFMSEPETSQVIEVAPAAVDHSPLAESEIPDVENVVSQPETKELKPAEVEHIFSPQEETTVDVAADTSAPIHGAAQHPQEIAAQEIFQPESNIILVTEDVLGDKGNEAELITEPTKLKGSTTTEDIEVKDIVVKEEEHDLVFAPTLHDVEPELKVEASAEPVPASIDRSEISSIEHVPAATAHSDEPAAIAEGLPENTPDENTPTGTKLQSTLEEETAGVDVVSSKDASTAVVAHKEEAEVTEGRDGTDASIAAPTNTNDLVAAESTETEQPVMPTTEDDATRHMNVAFVKTVPLTTTEDVSSMDKLDPGLTYEVGPEADNDLVASGTTPNIDLDWEHKVDATVSVAKDTPDIMNLRDEPSPVPLPLGHEIGPIKTEVEEEIQVEVAYTPAIEDAPTVEVQPDPSPSETAPNIHKDIEVETQVDDSSNIKHESIPESDITYHIEAESEGPLKDALVSSMKVPQTTTQLDPEAPEEEKPSVISQVETDSLPPRIENEDAPSQTLGEISVLEPQAIIAEDVETEGHLETGPIPTTQASVVVESEVASLTDAASIAPEAPVTTHGIEMGEVVGTLVLHETIVAPVSEVAIRGPEIETQAPVKPSITDKLPSVFTSEPETSQVIEVVPSAVDYNSLAESESLDKNAVTQPENTEVQPKPTEAEHVFSQEETVVGVCTGKTSVLAQIDAAAQYPPEVPAQGIFQPQSDTVLVTEDILGDSEDHQVITERSKLVDAEDTAVKKGEYAFSSAPALHDVTNLEPEVKTEVSPESVPAPIDLQPFLSTEHEPTIVHSDEPAGRAEVSPEIALDEATPVCPTRIELHSELEEDTAQETAVDVVSSSKDASIAIVAREVGAEVTDETPGTDVAIATPTTTNELTAVESIETEQHVMQTPEGDVTKYVNDAFVESTPEAGNYSAESGTTLNLGPHEVDVAEDTITSLCNDPPLVLSPLGHEIGAIKTEVKPSETAPNTHKDIEVETQVDDSSNIKHEPIPESDITHHIEAADTEGPFEDVPASRMKDPPTTTQLDPEAPEEEKPFVISQVETDSLPPRIENEDASSQTPGEISVLEPRAITVEDVETEGHLEIGPIPTTQASVVVESEVASLIDAASIVPEAPVTTQGVEVEESVGTLVQHEPIVAPVSEVAIPEPEIETETPVKPLTTEEPSTVFTSEPETSQVIEVVPSAVDHNPLAESEKPDVKNAVSQPETKEPKSAEAEHIFSPQEETTIDVAADTTTDSAPIHGATQHSQEIVAQEIFQPQSNTILVTEDVLGDRENEAEVITEPTQFKGFTTTEDKDIIVKEENHDFASTVPALHDVANLEPEVKTATFAELALTSIEPHPSIGHESATIAEHSPEIAFTQNTLDYPTGIELYSELEQETAHEAGVDVVSRSRDASIAIVTHEVEVTDETHGTHTPIATNANDLVAAESTETEQSVMPTTEGEATKQEVEAEVQVETASMPIIEGAPVDVEVQPDPSLTESAPDVQKDIEGQIVVPVDDQSEHVALVDPSCTDKFVEAVLPSVEESPATLVPHVGSSIIAEVGALALVQITEEPAAPVELNLVQEAAANMSVLSQEPTVSPETEQPVTHKDAAHTKIPPIPEVNVSATGETEPGPFTTNSTSGDKVSTLEMEEHVLLSSDSHDAAHMEPNDAIIPLTTAETEPEVVASVSGTHELHTQHSVMETTQEVHTTVQAPGGTEVEVTVPDQGPSVLPTAVESHFETADFVQSDPKTSELTNTASLEVEMAAVGIFFAQDKTAAEAKEDSVQEVSTEASNIDQHHALSSQTENLFDHGGKETATMAQDKRDVQIESTDPPVQEVTVNEEASPEESSATVEDSNGYSDINSLNIEQSAGVELVEESPISEMTISDAELPNEVVQEPNPVKIDEVTLELRDDAAVSATMDELSTENPVIDNPIEGAEAENIDSDKLQHVSQTGIAATDNVSLQDVEFDIVAAKELSETAPVLLELPEEQPKILEITGSSIIESSVNTVEKEVGSTKISTKLFEETKHSVPEIKGVSEIHFQANLTDVRVLTETKDNLREPSDSHGFEKSVEAAAASEPATAAPSNFRIEADDVTHAGEDLVNPALRENSVQDGTVAPLVEFKEVAATPSTDGASAVVISEPATMVHEDLQIEDGSIIQAEEDLVDPPPPPTDNPVQGAVVRLEAAEILPTHEPSVTGMVVVSELASVVEDVQIDSGSIPQAEQISVDPLPTDDPVQKAVEITSAGEPPVAEALSAVVPGSVLEDLGIDNGPPPPTDNPVPTLEAEEQHLLPSSESHNAIHIESNDKISSFATAEPGPGFATPVSGTHELQAQHPVEGTKEEVHAIIQPSGRTDVEVIVPDQGPSVLPTAMESHLETVDFVQSKPKMAETAPDIQEVSTKASNIDQSNSLSAQTEDLIDRGGSGTDATVGQSKRYTQIESIHPAVQEAVVSEEVNYEESSTTAEEFSGHSGSSVQQSARAELIEEGPVNEITISSVELPAELVQEPDSVKVDEVTSELQEVDAEVSATMADESPVIDNFIEEQQVGPAKASTYDRLEDLSQADIVTTATDFPTRGGGVDIITTEAKGNLVQDLEAPVEAEESVEMSSTAEPSWAEMASVVSGLATVSPDDLWIETDSITHAEEILVGSPPTDEPVHEEIFTPPKKAIEVSFTHEPSAAEILLSEPITVSEDLEIDNGDIVVLVDPSPTDNPAQEEGVVPIAEFQEAIEVFSTDEPSTAAVEDLQIEDDGITQEEDLVEAKCSVEIPEIEGISETHPQVNLTDFQVLTEAKEHVVQDLEPIDSQGDLEESTEISSTAQPSLAEAASLISEPATVVPESLQIENGDITHAEQDPDNAIQEDLAVESVDIVEPSVAESASVVSEPATAVPGSHQIENNGITQAEDPTLPNPVLVRNLEVKESVETSLAAETASRLSQLATVPEDLQIENGSITQTEEHLLGPPGPPSLIDIPVQEAVVAPLVQFQAVEISSIDQSSPVPADLHIETGQAVEDLLDPSDNLAQEEANIPLVEGVEISSTDKPSTVVSEDLQIDNGEITQVDEALIDSPLLTDNPVQEAVVEISSRDEPSTVVHEDLHIENSGITSAEEHLVSPLPLTDNPVQEETVAPLVEFQAAENFSIAEPSVAETASIVSDPSTKVPEEISINCDGITQTEGDLNLVEIPPSLLSVSETEHIGERTEGQVNTAIQEMMGNEGMVVNQVKPETRSDETEVEAPETYVLNANSATTQETIETLNEPTSVNLAYKDDIKAEPVVIGLVHHISPLETPSTTD